MKHYECQNCGYVYTEQEIVVETVGYCSYDTCPNCGADYEEFGKYLGEVTYEDGDDVDETNYDPYCGCDMFEE